MPCRRYDRLSHDLRSAHQNFFPEFIIGRNTSTIFDWEGNLVSDSLTPPAAADAPLHPASAPDFAMTGGPEGLEHTPAAIMYFFHCP